jgi:hypothetical protein
MVPAPHAVRSLLALKILGKERTSHVMEMCFDPGIALFAGLNAVPKRSFLAEYSARVDPRNNLAFLGKWSEAVQRIGLRHGSSFDLDFHSIPANSEAEPLEKHYISTRSRSQKGILAFLVRDAEENVMCYGKAGVPKPEKDDQVIQFAEYWKGQTGHYPKELVFDSHLTTFAKLHKITERGIFFITLRRRSKKMLANIDATPLEKWQRVTLPALTRQYLNPRIMESMVKIKDYHGDLRQLTIADLEHEEPTILLTNQFNASVIQLITRYAHPAHANRKRHRGCNKLLSPGCPLLHGRFEGRFRSSANAHGRLPLPDHGLKNRTRVSQGHGKGLVRQIVRRSRPDHPYRFRHYRGVVAAGSHSPTGWRRAPR